MTTTEAPQTMIIDGTPYVRADSAALWTDPDSPVKIVILQRGWVMVGRWSQDGETCSLDNAQTIRQWGTKKGLGEIAANGPTSTTVLDPTGHVEFHVLAVVAAISCREDKWSL